MRDNWRPMPCRHGVWARIEQDFISWDTGHGYLTTIPGPKHVLYDCPTPNQCQKEAYDMENRSTPGHQMRVDIWEGGFQRVTQAHLAAWQLIPHLVLRPQVVDDVLGETLKAIRHVR